MMEEMKQKIKGAVLKKIIKIKKEKIGYKKWTKNA